MEQDSNDYYEEYEKYLKKIGYPEKAVTLFTNYNKPPPVKATQVVHLEKFQNSTSLFDEQDQLECQNSLQLEALIHHEIPSKMISEGNEIINTLSKDSKIINENNNKNEFNISLQLLKTQEKQSNLNNQVEQDEIEDNCQQINEFDQQLIQQMQQQNKLATPSEIQLDIEQELNINQERNELFELNEVKNFENSLTFNKLIEEEIHITSNSINNSQETHANQEKDKVEENNLFEKRLNPKEKTQVIFNQDHRQQEQQDFSEQNINTITSVFPAQIEVPVPENVLQSLLMNLFKDVCDDALIKPKYNQAPINTIKQISKKQMKRDKKLLKKQN